MARTVHGIAIASMPATSKMSAPVMERDYSNLSDLVSLRASSAERELPSSNLHSEGGFGSSAVRGVNR